MTITLDEFRDLHGDPATWCAAEIDSYLTAGDMNPPVPPLYSHAEMQAIAADYEKSAEQQKAVAERLAADGRGTAAGIWERGAQEARQYAAAARFGYPHFEAVLNGW
ncbi:hypothetical protein OG612_42600 (plasmid) [Streptomyces sp. NBC_01527]|uniref:hypothetical protein n=1 Tax=unclassified Streptomyces TaxID=2593676 RepID=UPI002E15A668|nr:hypothetical protein OG763_45605 [Streptomyces sp. NBC_01230]